MSSSVVRIFSFSAACSSAARRSRSVRGESSLPLVRSAILEPESVLQRAHHFRAPLGVDFVIALHPVECFAEQGRGLGRADRTGLAQGRLHVGLGLLRRDFLPATGIVEQAAGILGESRRARARTATNAREYRVMGWAILSPERILCPTYQSNRRHAPSPAEFVRAGRAGRAGRYHSNAQPAKSLKENRLAVDLFCQIAVTWCEFSGDRAVPDEEVFLRTIRNKFCKAIPQLEALVWTVPLAPTNAVIDRSRNPGLTNRSVATELRTLTR